MLSEKLIIVLVCFFSFQLSAWGIIKILPLGNSITYDVIANDQRDVGEKISYRYRLYQLLMNGGYDFDYVGTEKSGGYYLPDGYTDNGGFPGLTNSQLLTKLRQGYLINLDPDIILLEIGTNGLKKDNEESYAATLDSILNEIDNYETRASKVVHVFLAQIINRGGTEATGNSPPTSKYNQLIANLKTSRPNDELTIVNLETGAGLDYRYIPVGDMHDLYHPIQSGYVKMAEKWFSALKPYLDSALYKSPVLSATESDTLIYPAGTQKIIFPSIVVTNSSTLKSAIVKFSSGYKTMEDTLYFTPSVGITYNWNAATGTLTLTGDASGINYANTLQTIGYKNSNNKTPTSDIRNISFIVSDGISISNEISRKVKIKVNSAPTLSGIETNKISYMEGAGKVALTNSLVIFDNDNSDLKSAVVKFDSGFSKQEDVLSFTATDGISALWNNLTGILILTGKASVAKYQSALRNIRYENTNSINPSIATRTISFVVNDSSTNSNIVIRKIEITRVNSKPEITNLEVSSLNYSIGADNVNLTSTLTISDLDNASLSSAMVQIDSGYNAARDVLAFEVKEGLNFSWNISKGILTINGTASLADYQDALRKIKFKNNKDTISSVRLISFMVSDGQNSSDLKKRRIILRPSKVLNNPETMGNYSKLSPNPTTGYLKLEFAEPLKQTIQVKIINSQGITIKTETIEQSSTFFEFHIDDLSNGLYYIKLGNAPANYKFIKLK